MTSYRVRTHAEAGDALERAGALLAQHPVECNLHLTLLHERVEQPEPGHYWTVADGDAVVGLAMQSPPTRPLLLTPMPGAAVEAVADAMASKASEPAGGLPGVVAEAGVAARFAGAWAERRRVVARPREGGRLYRLDGLADSPVAAGSLRPAHEGDAGLLLDWARAFDEQTGNDPGIAAAALRRRLASRRAFVWEDTDLVSMACATEPVAGVSRIGYVYTPPEWRRRGYASALVAQLSRQVLETEAGTCILFTELHNPTSNGIYRRIGYQAVAETLIYTFEDAEDGATA
jgi:GNAT superfamily N-acetyltransferase